MKVPILQKIKYHQVSFIERALDSKGKIEVKVGDKLQPFSKIGKGKKELYAGFSGVVKKIIPQRAVLLESSVRIVKGVVSTPSIVDGELRLLSANDSALETTKLSVDLKGKILVGAFASCSVLQKAQALGIGGFVLGGIEAFDFETYLRKGLNLLILEGFGQIPINFQTWEVLKESQGKFVILRGETKELIVPESDD